MRRGTSLIEILVVLVILVVGILSIIRLFPAGFIALRNAQDSTFADRLAEGAIEALKKDGAALPDAIYMYSDTDGFIPSYAPDNYGPYPATGTADATYNDINKARYISNETMVVPSSHVVNGTSYPPLYTVNYGPIYLPSDYSSVATPAVSVHYLRITSTPWTAISGDSRQYDAQSTRGIDNPTDILGQGDPQYLVDYKEGKIAVPPAAYQQIFTLVITPVNGPPTTDTLTIPANYDGGWFNSVDGTMAGTPFKSAAPWKSVTLTRPFFYMGTSNTPLSPNLFTNDPYEYAVFDSNFGTNSNANPGVIAFNPLASGQAGAQALHARISYMVYDWHIMHEDRNVAAGSPSVRLTINHLKKIGDVQFDQSTFKGLIPDATGNNLADIMLLDLNTGLLTPLNASNVYDLDDSTGATGQFQVSYQNGRITFPASSPAQNVRIFYAGDADWALAIQKAPSVYTLGSLTTIKENSTVSGMMPNQYFVDEAAERVYFPICDEGKTVEFDNIAYTNTGSPSTTKQIGQATAPISTDLAANGLPYINLSSGGLNPSGIIPDGITPGTLSIGAVRGVSARAVVIWHENNQWRTRTLDTLLTQP